MCEDAITFADGGQLLGKLNKTSVDPRGLEGFVKVNYSMQGTVAYQTFLQGVVAGLSLAFGPAGEPRTDLEEGSDTVELTGDGTGQAAAELQQSEMTGLTEKRFVPDGDPVDLKTPAVASEETRGLTPPGSPATEASGAVSP